MLKTYDKSSGPGGTQADPIIFKKQVLLHEVTVTKIKPKISLFWSKNVRSRMRSGTHFTGLQCLTHRIHDDENQPSG